MVILPHVQVEIEAWERLRYQSFRMRLALAYERWLLAYDRLRGINTRKILCNMENPMTDSSREEFTQLGRMVDIPTRPEDALLETFQNRNPGIDYVVRLTAPELTSICPITGQPDFAALVIDYVPDERLVESKSFKLFLESFRNCGTFNEDCTVYIHKRLRDVLVPKYIRVVGLWNARGGVAIDVVIESGSLPPNCIPLPVDRIAYRGGRV
jgi:7-cyano-7-deazaguanine reductase